MNAQALLSRTGRPADSAAGHANIPASLSLPARAAPTHRLRPSPARAAMQVHLMRHAAGQANDALLASLLSGWTLGEGILPGDFGLGTERFARLVARHFPGLLWHGRQIEVAGPVLQPEFSDLEHFLQAHADTTVASAADLVRVLAVGCMGSDHLWQDLGLNSRTELSALIALNFPRLAAANCHDMKWKKFLYRELCEQEGIYVCTSPSCGICRDYDTCFGPED